MLEERKHLAIRRGDLYTVDLGFSGESIWRPVLVIQNDIGNRFGNSVIVTPLIAKPQNSRFIFGVEIPAGLENRLKEDFIVILSQIRTIEKKRFEIDNFCGTLPEKIMFQVDKALELSLGLSFIQRLESRQGKTGRNTRYPKDKFGS